jgi:hypothetical protein
MQTADILYGFSRMSDVRLKMEIWDFREYVFNNTESNPKTSERGSAIVALITAERIARQRGLI